MKVLFQFVFCLALAAAGASSTTNRKVQLALLDLDDGQVRVPAKEIFGRDLDLGHGVRGLLAKCLERGGYTIVEWKALVQFLTEQGLPPEGRTDAGAVARVAQIVAERVDFVVIGNITQFGRDSRTQVTGIDPEGRKKPMWRTDRQIARIELRVISVASGEVVFVVDGSGEAKGTGASALQPLGGGRMTGRGVDFSTPDFAATMPGEAITMAVEQAGARLAAAGIQPTPKSAPAEARILRVQGDRVELGAGARSGLRQGDQIPVDRLVQEVKDPATQRVIRRIWEPVGSVEISEVRDETSAARIISGDGIMAGDIAGAAKNAATSPPLKLLAVMLTREMEKRRALGFDEDTSIQPSTADLRVGRTVFVQPMPYDLHVFIAASLRESKPLLFEVVEDPRKADLWILGKAGYTGKMRTFEGSVEIVPRGDTTVLWSGKSGYGGYDPGKDTEVSSAAKRVVKRMIKSLTKE